MRPLSVGEVIDTAFKLYFRHWGRFAALVAVIIVPVEAIDALVRSSTVDSVGGGHVYYQDRSAYHAGVVVIQVLSLLASLLIVAVVFRAVSEAYLGRSPEIGASLRFALRRVLWLLWTNVLEIVGVALVPVVLFFAIGIGGVVLGLVPAVFLWVLWSVAVPSLMVEGAHGTRALRRSAGLVNGRWWSTLAILFIGTLLVQGAVGFLIGLIAGLIIVNTTSLAVFVLVTFFVGTVVQVLLLPVTVAVTTVLYYDLRVRKEGLDLTLMIDALGLPAAGEGVGLAGLPAPIGPPGHYPPPLGGPLPPPSGAPLPGPGYGPPPPSGPPLPPPTGAPYPEPAPPPPPPRPPVPVIPPGTAPPGWAPPVAPDVAPPQDSELRPE